MNTTLLLISVVLFVHQLSSQILKEYEIKSDSDTVLTGVWKFDEDKRPVSIKSDFGFNNTYYVLDTFMYYESKVCIETIGYNFLETETYFLKEHISQLISYDSGVIKNIKYMFLNPYDSVEISEVSFGFVSDSIFDAVLKNGIITKQILVVCNVYLDKFG